jgi:hypothetical protein
MQIFQVSVDVADDVDGRLEERAAGLFFEDVAHGLAHHGQIVGEFIGGEVRDVLVRGLKDAQESLRQHLLFGFARVGHGLQYVGRGDGAAGALGMSGGGWGRGERSGK